MMFIYDIRIIISDILCKEEKNWKINQGVINMGQAIYVNLKQQTKITVGLGEGKPPYEVPSSEAQRSGYHEYSKTQNFNFIF
jgi:hypothetical protein